jgi:NTE family protein
MVNSATATLDRRRQSDLLITPALESLDLLDWKGFRRAIEIGYRDACERLEGGALEQLRMARTGNPLS